ncbi:MAG: cysteine peptidase family C39 domain-containing protein [Mycoplasma sp.]|nr:cysteine peptidase family C39 domain-containing protein [Mycoplasma sp.]
MRIIKQTDIKDCGLSVIQSLHEHYFHNLINIETLRSKVNFDSKGLNILTLKELALEYGLILTSYTAEVKDIFSLKIKKPIIVLVINKNQKHFIIIKKIVKGNLTILDPINGKYNISKKDFEKIFANVLIIPDKTVYLKKNNNNNNIFIDTILQNKKQIYILLLANILNIAFSIIASYFIKIVTDTIIPNYLNKTLLLLTFSFICLTIIKIINFIFRKYILKILQINISNTMINLFIYKIINTDEINRNKLSKPEIQRRIEKVNYVIEYYLHVIEILFVDIFVIVGLMIFLFFINYNLSLIVLMSIIAIFIFELSTLFINKSQTIEHQNLSRDLANDLYNSIHLRTNSNNVLYKNETSKRVVKSIKELSFNSMQLNKISWYNQFISLIIKQILPILVICFFVKLIFNNELSIGSMLLFTSTISYLFSPFNVIASVIVSYNEFKNSKRQLLWILNLPTFENKSIFYDDINKIEIRDLNFELQKGKSILKIPELIIDKNIQIIGKIGSGKTTLLKIISGYIKTNSLFINDINYNKWSKEKYQNQMFYGNDFFLPDINFLKFIANNDMDSLDNFVNNIKPLSQEFEELGITFETTLTNNLDNFSSGQKQFIRLLPLLTRKFKYILLDEVSNNIDEKLWQKLWNKIIDFQDKATFVLVDHKKESSFKKVYMHEINKI